MEPLKASLWRDDPSACVSNLELTMCDVEISLGDVCDDAGYFSICMFSSALHLVSGPGAGFGWCDDSGGAACRCLVVDWLTKRIDNFWLISSNCRSVPDCVTLPIIA